MIKAARGFLGAGLLALSFSASAVPVTFDLSGSSSASVVDFDGGLLCGIFGCGVEATINPELDTLSATLNPGDSWVFDFFDLTFWGLGGGTGTIAASLGFDAPAGAPNAPGTGSGGFGTFLGAISGGELTWVTQPGSFSLSDGTIYSVMFENLHGLTVGSATVSGTITLIQGPGGSVSVPEPGTMGLLGLALLGMDFGARRKSAKSA